VKHDFLIADRSARGKLRFTGVQRAWYLHQITTQAFEDIAPGDSRDAAMLTVHGRMVGFFEAVATDEAILCHFEPELLPDFPEAIRRYVFATQVAITDVTDDMGLILTTGSTEVSVPSVAQEARWVGVPAHHIWVARGDVETAIGELRATGGQVIDEPAVDALRVTHGVPRWGREMDAKTFPQEVGIDSVAVHYDKGCYTGQEAMAKIHFRGKVNRKLAQLESGTPLRPGSDVLLEGTKIGTVTSAVSGPEGSFYGLALVKRDVPTGVSVDVGNVSARLSDAA
jgi:tRNA-modifying protein YgfZ